MLKHEPIHHRTWHQIHYTTYIHKVNILWEFVMHLAVLATRRMTKIPFLTLISWNEVNRMCIQRRTQGTESHI